MVLKSCNRRRYVESRISSVLGSQQVGVKTTQENRLARGDEGFELASGSDSTWHLSLRSGGDHRRSWELAGDWWVLGPGLAGSGETVGL